ncbi:hypothetical protein CCACVL1_06548 [Corchorus capsularis]|uniref:Uncharacterized protein n=1 Tax=Corchorus capsularis TaxID=210143 RepID=A0A1R3JES6_COCAP|nr:hypothetical protein CCACVL1_06548 [Corchorus capsularis]
MAPAFAYRVYQPDFVDRAPSSSSSTLARDPCPSSSS